VIQDVLSVLISWDIHAFTIINGMMSNAVLDVVFPFLTTTKNWLPIYVLGIGTMMVRGYRERFAGGQRLMLCAMMLVLTVAAADQLSHQLLKEVIQRPRPYMVLPDAIQRVGSGGGSFPSNHAMNSAIIAMILSTYFPRRRSLWWTYAGVIALSRVYCGVHYPSDVLGGLLIGAGVAMVMLELVRRIWPQLPIGPPPQASPEAPSASSLRQ
jgi:undecaprenyl-diphosphatase